jgi:hypothetical protein
MIQTNMFDQRGKPTELAVRYVTPKYYRVYCVDGCRKVRHAHTAIKVWLMHEGSKIAVVW